MLPLKFINQDFSSFSIVEKNSTLINLGAGDEKASAMRQHQIMIFSEKVLPSRVMRII